MKYLPPSIEHIIARWFDIERRSGRERNKSVTLTHRRIYILPTYFGLLFSLLLMLLLVGSTNYNNSLGFVLTFLLASICLVSITHTYRNLLNLKIQAGKAGAVFCGSTATFSLQLENPNKLARYHLRASFKGQPPPATNPNNTNPGNTNINANDSAEIRLTLPTSQRGWLTMERITIDTTYPMGLFRAWSYVTLPKSCLVYPAPAKTSLPPTGKGNGSGNQQSQQGSDDFIGFRDYHPGDSPRHVNWKAAAHSDELLTKRFADNESNELWFEWEALTMLETEARLSQLCRWVVDAQQSGLNYGLRLPHTTIPMGQGDEHQHRCLEALALFGTP